MFNFTKGTYRPRWSKWLRCENCFNEFSATRKDAKFCNARCRKQDQRIREKAEAVSRVLVSKRTITVEELEAKWQNVKSGSAANDRGHGSAAKVATQAAVRSPASSSVTARSPASNSKASAKEKKPARKAKK